MPQNLISISLIYSKAYYLNTGSHSVMFGVFCQLIWHCTERAQNQSTRMVAGVSVVLQHKDCREGENTSTGVVTQRLSKRKR